MCDKSQFQETVPIGRRIRELRLAQGYTLADLAKRAGTSAPALHRYENGWDRFTLATLRKIADALGACLEVSLSPMPSQARVSRRVQPGHLVKTLAPLFWDTELVEEHLVQHSRWVLARVLSEGSLEQAALARRFYGDAAILEVVDHRSVDARTRNYWQTILEA